MDRHSSDDSVVELEREKAERKEAEGSVAVFKRQLASLHDRCAALDMEIEQYKALVGNLERGAPVPCSTRKSVSLSHRAST